MKNSKRNCNGCTACCLTHPILELNKPAAAWCPHCNPGHNCKIYRDRPQGCQDFKCQWLLGEDTDNDRPDKTEIVLDLLNLPEIGEVFALFEAIPGALKNRFATEKTQAYIDSGMLVLHAPLVGENILYIPQKFLLKLPAVYPIVNSRRTKVFYKQQSLEG